MGHNTAMSTIMKNQFKDQLNTDVWIILIVLKLSLPSSKNKKFLDLQLILSQIFEIISKPTGVQSKIDHTSDSWWVPGLFHFESLVKCQFYAIDQTDASPCDSTSVEFLNCIENLKNSSLLQNCEEYVYEDEFMTKFGIYSGL